MYGQPDRVGRYDGHYSAVSALMVILIIGGVTRVNAEIVRMGLSLLVYVGAGVVTLSGLGYAVGSLVGSRALVFS